MMWSSLRKNILKTFFKYCPRFVYSKLHPCVVIDQWLESPTQLNWKQKIEIKFHYLICYGCWVSNKQIKMIQEGTVKILEDRVQEKKQEIENITNNIIEKIKCHKCS